MRNEAKVYVNYVVQSAADCWALVGAEAYFGHDRPVFGCRGHLLGSVLGPLVALSLEARFEA